MFTPDKGGWDSCTLPGVFCCSKKGQAMPIEGSRRDFHKAPPADSEEARTECCPQRKGIPWAWHEQGTGSRYPWPDFHLENDLYPEGRHRSWNGCPLKSCLPADYLYKKGVIVKVYTREY